MLIFFQEFIFSIILWVLRMIEGILEIFNILLGINIINANDEKEEIISYLINDSKILTIFISIFFITIFLCLIFIIASIIKNMLTNKQNISSIISKFFTSMISTLIVSIIFIIIISISNVLLNLLINILNIDQSQNISKLIFDNCVVNYFNYYSINEIDFSTITTSNLLGSYSFNNNLIYPSSWDLNGMINPNNFRYLPSLITSIIVLTSLLISIITLIKRIYKIVLLYIILPLSLSTIPLDDGLRFNNWRRELLKQLLIIFSITFSLNIFYLILPILLNINISENITSYSKSLINLLIISSGSIFITSSILTFNKIFTKININDYIR